MADPRSIDLNHPISTWVLIKLGTERNRIFFELVLELKQI